MRHRKKGKKMGRTAPHRKRTLQALSNALIENKQITTTIAKAKALRPFVEPLITRAKEDTEHNRRQVFRHLQNKEAISELFGEIADEVGDRPGGYTRIIKLGQRSGDGAELALVELVDYNDVKPSGSSSGGSGRTRRGSGKGRRSGAQQSSDTDADTDTDAEADADAEEAAEPEDASTAEAADEADTAAEAETTDEPDAASDSDEENKSDT
jgi:large subunit ribosomal protein L17